MHQELNSRLPIFKLPNELLVSVFHYYINISRHPSSDMECKYVPFEDYMDIDLEGFVFDEDAIDISSDHNSDGGEDNNSREGEDEISRGGDGETASPTSTTRCIGRMEPWWWLVPSQVCSRWRSLSLAHGALWNIIDQTMCYNSRLFSLALSRSLEAPLVATIIGGWFTSREEFAKTALGKLLIIAHRLQSLDLRIPLDDLEKVIEGGWFSESFSQLETLKIYVRIPSQILGTVPLERGIALPALLEKVTSRLTHLDLHDMFMDSKTFLSLPSTLTDLSLSYKDIPSPFSAGDLLAVLRRLTSLEGLHLQQILSGDTISSEVDLPNLKKLSLIDDKPTTVDLFQALSFPAITLIKLTLSLDPDDDGVTNKMTMVSQKIRRYIDTGERKITNATLYFNDDYDDVGCFPADRVIHLMLCYDEFDHHAHIFDLSINTNPGDNLRLWYGYVFPSLQETTLFSQINNLSVIQRDHHSDDWLHSLAEQIETIAVNGYPLTSYSVYS
ncbi:hypothetical protein QCA50_015411 [Cerrena zonata]|uniref:F-box domain-containing protein n=1 Tax=Cerrena zonata TaxID=2478898 RepID=A0AAW0FQX1_9APHY